MQIRAVNSAGAGPWSATEVRTPRAVPDAPVIGSVAGISRGLTLGWGAPASAGTEPITAYDVRHIRSDAADRSDANWTVHLAAWRSGVLETR